MSTFADKVISFNRNLAFTGALPEGISVMNPFKETQVLAISERFYEKFYNDNRERYWIIGINPGRFGGGVTGIPFTDTRRLKEKLGISYEGRQTYEPSSTFIYDMIDAYGGVKKFYSRFYIQSVFPLAITKINDKGTEVNYNYYDSKELLVAVHGFIIESIKKQLSFGIKRDVCFCLGTGKNLNFLQKLNKEHGFFSEIIPLEHPRYIVQYKSKQRQEYIEKYIRYLSRAK